MTLSQIRKRLIRALTELVKTCSEGHLSHLSFGVQKLGIVIQDDREDFDVHFCRDSDEGLPDLRKPYAIEEFLLSDVPALASEYGHDALALVEKAMEIADIKAHQRERLLEVTPTYPLMLEALMINPRVTKMVRRRLLETFKLELFGSVEEIVLSIDASIDSLLAQDAAQRQWLEDRRLKLSQKRG